MLTDVLPVDPFAIAAAKSIVVKAMPPSSSGFSGLLQRLAGVIGGYAPPPGA